MRVSQKLEGSELWLGEDTTEREEFIQDWIRKERLRPEQAVVQAAGMVVINTVGVDGKEEEKNEEREKEGAKGRRGECTGKAGMYEKNGV